MRITTSDRQVVVTGRSVVSTLGDDVTQVMEGCYHGGDNFTELGSTNSSNGGVYVGICNDLDIGVLPDKKVRKAMVRKDLIGLVAALKASADARITKGSINPDQFGIYVGSSSTQIGDLEPYHRLLRQCVVNSSFDSKLFGRELSGNVNPLVMLQTLMNNTLCYASVALDIRGVNGNFMDFQSAGARAAVEGFHAIKEGRAEAVLVGGASGCPETFQMQQGIDSGYLAHGEALDPESTIKPYSQSRCGTILSEGASFLVLEEQVSAIRRGANILARVADVSMASEGDFAFLNSDKSTGLPRCIKRLIEAGSIELDKLGLIFGHGNGSLHGDIVEYQSYLDAFDNQCKSMKLTSTKANLGETTEASANIAAAFAVDILNGADIPPVKNFDSTGVNENLAVSAERAPYEKSQILVTSRGFSGLCCALVLEKI